MHDGDAAGGVVDDASDLRRRHLAHDPDERPVLRDHDDSAIGHPRRRAEREPDVFEQRSKLRWQPIGIDLLPEVFSLPELQQVYEAILGHSIVRRTLRRRVASYGVLVPAGSRRIAGDFGGRPPDLWRFDRDAYEALLEEGGKFEL